MVYVTFSDISTSAADKITEPESFEVERFNSEKEAAEKAKAEGYKFYHLYEREAEDFCILRFVTSKIA